MSKFPLLLIALLFLCSCSSNKNIVKTPFSFGKVYTQKWIVEDNLEYQGYNVVIPILRLDKKAAVLHNVYHKGKVLKLKIKLKEIGVVALAKFPEESFLKPKNHVINSAVTDNDAAILSGLQDNEVVISYWVKDKIKYHKISNIRHNPLMSYPNSVMAEFD